MNFHYTVQNMSLLLGATELIFKDIYVAGPKCKETKYKFFSVYERLQLYMRNDIQHTPVISSSQLLMVIKWDDQKTVLLFIIIIILQDVIKMSTEVRLTN
jgi:hypothetical protein